MYANGKNKNNLSTILVLSAIGMLFLYIVFRNQGLYPTVFSDEYFYSKFSRLVSLSLATVPDYLYFTIYHSTNYCGHGFLGCARILNAVFFVSTFPFIYLLAKQLASKKMALFIAFISLIGPINSYTAYFMPESMYFFGFWLLSWFLLGKQHRSQAVRWSVSGLILGCLSLVKPHALFLFPSLVLLIMVSVRGKSKFNNLIFFVISALLSKLVLGAILAGKAGVTVFGSLYSGAANSALGNPGHIFNLLTSATIVLKGHLLGLCLLFALPLMIATNYLVNVVIKKREIKLGETFAIYAFALLLTLLAVVALYTASTGTSGPYESLNRIHMRYYDFIFPLFFMVSAYTIGIKKNDSRVSLRIVLASPFIIGIVAALWTKMTPYTPSFVDSPELRGVVRNTTVFYSLGLLSIAGAVIWIYKELWGARYFVFLYLPILTIISTYFINQDLNWSSSPNKYDKAGIILRNYLGAKDLDKTVVVGSDLAGLYRTLFHLDSAGASLKSVSENNPVPVKSMLVNKEWIAVFGDHRINQNSFFVQNFGSFRLVHSVERNSIKFNQSIWPGFVSEIKGLSGPEDWGRWSDAKVVTIKFTNPLPKSFSLKLTAKAFGPNVGKAVVVEFSAETKSIEMSETQKTYDLSFNNSKESKMLSFVVPDPVSPKSLGINKDSRKIGVGFIALEIVPDK